MKLKIVITSILISCIGYSQQPINKNKGRERYTDHQYDGYNGGLTGQGLQDSRAETDKASVAKTKALMDEWDRDEVLQANLKEIQEEEEAKKAVEDSIKEGKHKEALRVQAKLDLVTKQLELKKQENTHTIEKILSYFLLAIILIGLYYIIQKIKTSVNFSQLTNTFTMKAKRINLKTLKFKLSDKEIIAISISLGIISAVVFGNYLYPSVSHYTAYTRGTEFSRGGRAYAHAYPSFNFPLGIICFIVTGGVTYFILNKIKKTKTI
ncbi:hypothetical protein [Flavobacterium sp. A45]|uniref:hypothetical protein n=1 Tax=Flavobacterium sp. A45 TaxID=1945862 RepID=UPI000F4EDB73|nr:hypothetical protein [Flavobacterium sp. A45]